jgi:glycosyltransferase involved in cell wall biosynthesis
LLVVSRLVKQKRLDRFLSILARLRNDFHLSVRGLIAGPGCADEDLRPDLEAQAKDLGLLPEGVEFRGAVSDMAPLYREAAICVLTSDHEGTPNALLEAMASGLPVVATRVGGVPGIVQHRQSGLLFESDDLDGMVAGLLQLAENAPLRKQMGQRGRAYVEENHSLHRLPIRLHELYRLALRTKTACFDATFPNASPAH